MDAGKSSDIAYFGRLPRPDGRGTFLYIAGIHAAGPGAVIHFLATHLGEFYKEAHLKRFSTLIEGEFDANTRRAISSRRITPLYIHEGR
jgi:hypothetical protein